MTFAESIREQLQARKGDWPKICAETGISYWWITKFAQGRIGNPGVRHLEALSIYFASLRQSAPASESLNA
ncbi:hypothetical protein [Neopusillimonas aromaticivorans]|uniref:hypothetical protein n=1 Tax=Neopusillimonas aromaticivorans TaxID=2979868 RepID=UPI002598A3DA|nr:hypothetical protein [Neopusillimonas aromaticivorans]NLZ10865.1 hypothetical protein [Alcaligenaceae bacterium]WJJ93421.1 hypothetical protein N7E01_15885 [Neopusillimonas aromaticivorans]